MHKITNLNPTLYYRCSEAVAKEMKNTFHLNTIFLKIYFNCNITPSTSLEKISPHFMHLHVHRYDGNQWLHDTVSFNHKMAG